MKLENFGFKGDPANQKKEEIKMKNTINYHEITGQESGIVIEKNVLAACNWAIGGEIEIDGVVKGHGEVVDIKSMLDYIQRDGETIWEYNDVLDDNDDLTTIIKEATPGEWWEIETNDGDMITVIAPKGWN